ncbi:hypothetical protein [Clostridium sp.]|uniref:hypothetical protein n=1 Tax=Clostridium sp. TaxID=1506 RepID=UPI0032163870
MINYQIEKHGVCFTSKVLAAQGGKHIYNIKIAANRDNGSVVAKGEWGGMEYYEEKASTGVTAVVLEQAANDNWYVEITNPGDGIVLRNVPMIAEEFTKKFQKEENFFNGQGEIVRGYELAAGDILELSEACFTGTPVAKKTLTIENYKWKVATV